MLAQQPLECVHTTPAVAASTGREAHLRKAARTIFNGVGNVAVGKDLALANDHGGVLLNQ
jgi:hypothetical protein